MSLLAVALVLFSAVLHALWSFAIKGSRDPLSFNLVQRIPAAVAAVALLLLLPPVGLGAGFWAIVAAASVTHALYLYWLARACETGDLSLVYPIARATPAFLPLAAVLLLGERISPLAGVSIAVVVAGLWLVPFEHGFSLRVLRGPGAFFAFLTLAATVGYGLTDKAAMLRLDAVDWKGPVPRSVYYFLLADLGAGLVLAPLVLRARGLTALGPVVRHEGVRACIALAMSLASYGLVLEVLRESPVSYVVAVRQASVPFALAISILWLGERPSRMRLVGAALTVAGVAGIGAAP